MELLFLIFGVLYIFSIILVFLQEYDNTAEGTQSLAKAIIWPIKLLKTIWRELQK